jgi:hypothetical protein
MMRKGVSTLCVLAWIHRRLCNIDAFHPTTKQNYATRRADRTQLFAQQIENPQQQQDKDKNHDSKDTNVSSKYPFFAQGEELSQQEANPDKDEASTLLPSKIAADDADGTEIVTPNRSSPAMKRASAPPSPPQYTMFHPKTSAGQELLEAVLDVTVAGSMEILVRQPALYIFL